MAESKFLGRERELAGLVGAWERARNGEPQMRVLVADSGYGKTRLVQALYSRVSADFDPGNYWPDDLLASDNSLRVMPALETVPDSADMPWFWWGVRWPNPNMHNPLYTSSRLLESYADDAMQRHFDALKFNLERRQAMTAAGISLVKALISLVPGAVSVAELLNASLDILEAARIGRNYRTRVERAEVEEKRHVEAIARALALFATILESVGEDGKGLPVVLFLDDAQWMDPFTVRILDELWATAKDRKWPLLVVVTHWEHEWLLSHDPNGTGPAFSSWFQGANRDSADEVNVLKLTRLDLSEMTELLERELPGLSGEQREYYLRTASGNPRFLAELGPYLRVQPELFVDQDVEKPMTEHGFAESRFPGLAIEELERRRFNKALPRVKLALALSSMQGDQFLREFTLDVAASMHADEITAAALHEAERPFVLAASLDESRMEFRSSAIYARSEQYLRAIGNEAADRAHVATVKEWVSSGQMRRMRRDAMFDQVHSALAASLDSQQLQDVATLMSFMIEQMKLAGDFRYAMDISSRARELVDALKEQIDNTRLVEFLPSYLQLLDALVGTGYASIVLQEGSDCREHARRAGSNELEVLAIRIHAEALAGAGMPDMVLKVASELPQSGLITDQIQADRVLLLKADALYSLDRVDEAAEAYDEAISALEKSDKTWGAFLHAAAVGRLRTLIRDGIDGWNEEYLVHVIGYAKALTTARGLAGSIPYGSRMGAPPTWIKASVYHDMGMLDLAMAITTSNQEDAKEHFSNAVERFGEALEMWDEEGLRPELRARTVWVRAASGLCSVKVKDAVDGLDDALRVIAELRGQGHPEVEAAQAVREACLQGDASDGLLLQVLKHGWQRVDVDLSGPPREPRERHL